MRKLLVAALVACVVAAGASSAAAATLCVGAHGGCFAQIQPALDAAHDGDTIAIGPGTFTGGITIEKSVHVRGTSAGATFIRGGGPVVTILRATDPGGQKVSIDGVTITDGVNTATPGQEVTFGGGVLIAVSQLDHPPFNGPGATVSISNSVITGNTVASSLFIPPGFCGPRACAFSSGGGIDNGGVLTLTNSRVTNNTAGSTPGLASAASDANAGGINNHFASTLVVRNSVVSGNRAVADSAIANHASAGGIGSDGAIDVEDSVVSGNSIEYTGSMDFDSQSGFAGGINLDQCGCFGPQPAAIRNTRVSGNGVVAVNTNPNSTPAGFGGGMTAFVPASLDHVMLSDNSVHMTGAGFAGGDGGGMEVDAPVTVRDSVVARNSVVVEGPKGAIAFGGGIAMFGGDLTLERTVVNANSASAAGAAAPLPFGGVSSALGGGISNGAPGIPSATLTLTDSVVNANRLSGSPGIPLQGGGIFTGNGIARTNTVIAGNKPDDCFGC
jgi:hypothetical protein